METQKIDQHLQQALTHLREALNISIALVEKKQGTKEQIGKKWEGFFGDFFGSVKAKGKEHKLNLLSWISFPKIWRW